jgi:hypothetical protein
MKNLWIIILLLPGLLVTSAEAQSVSYEKTVYDCTLYISEPPGHPLGTGMIKLTFHNRMKADEMEKIVKDEVRKAEAMYVEQGLLVFTTCKCKTIGMRYGGGIGTGYTGGLERAEQPMKNITK